MSTSELLDVCVVGFGGKCHTNHKELNPKPIPFLPAIGALYAYALDKSKKARVTAVCR